MEAGTGAEKVFSRLEEWGCDIDGGLERFLDDKELYIRCLTRFSHDPVLLNLKECIREENWKGAYEAAHSLKGSSGTLNITPVYKAARNITTLLVGDYTPDKAQLDGLMDKLSEVYAEYCRRIRA